LADVQPPKTVATLSCLMSFWAFSAKVGQSEAPSSTIGSSLLPSTPPEALISSIAISSAFFTVTSLMAIVPLSECRTPTLMVLPPVPEADPDDSFFVEAHAVSDMADTTTTAVSTGRDFLGTTHLPTPSPRLSFPGDKGATQNFRLSTQTVNNGL